MAALSVALGGCTDDPVAVESQTATVSPTPSPTPTPTAEVVTAPVRPAEMERSDEVGAVAAATYFMELFAYVEATGDVTEWDAISDPGCGFCSGVRQASLDTFADGGSREGAELTLLSPPQVEGYDGTIGVYALSIPFTIAPYRKLDGAGDVLVDAPVESGVALLEVQPSVGGWLLIGANKRAE